MGRRGVWATAAMLGAVVALRCGPAPAPRVDDGGGGAVDSGAGPQQVADAGTDAGEDDAGTPPNDAGAGDAGSTDAGTPDGGADAGTPDAGSADAGTPDAGTVTVIELPTAEGWTFYGPQQGGPVTVNGVTADEGGNLWVAGGEEGLFLLRKGQSTFERLTLADGLHPYGYLPDGSDAPGPHYLNVISVAGGPAGTVFVGYKGRPPPDGARDCEGNWDGPSPDPSIYKSGDADKVTLTSSGIDVVHYDIFSGPNVVRDEPRGREKLCDILRIAYDPNTHSVWFGGNHGFARGDSRFTGNPTCNGQVDCSGVLEHVHPAICAVVNGTTVVLTDAYRGVAPDPATGDVWFGGANRSTRFKYGSYGSYWTAQVDTEARDDPWSRIDVWPDAVPEQECPTVAQRKDDVVSGAAVMNDGTVYISSFAWGLAHLDGDGHVMSYRTEGLIAPHVSALAADKWDQSLWIGHRWGGGVSRLKGGGVAQYSEQVFGPALTWNPISDIQVDRSAGSRRVLVGFQSRQDASGNTIPGAVGVYTGG